MNTITLASLAVGLASCLWSLYLLRWSRKVARGVIVILRRANERTKRAEDACEELRKSVMKGSAVGRWVRTDNAPSSDAWYHHILTANGPLLLTDEQWTVASERAKKLLK